MSLDIHQDIYTQLNTFFDENRVPNIIFYGRNGSGKKTIVKNYINKIYKTKEEQKKYVLIVDCIQSVKRHRAVSYYGAGEFCFLKTC